MRDSRDSGKRVRFVLPRDQPPREFLGALWSGVILIRDPDESYCLANCVPRQPFPFIFYRDNCNNGILTRSKIDYTSWAMPSTTAQLSNQHVDVLEMNEAFEEVDGFRFSGTLIVYRVGSDLHHAVSKARYSSPSEVKAEHLVDDVLIPVPAYNPPFSSKFTRAPDTLPVNSYVKRPRLISYDRISRGSWPNQIADSVLVEVEVCELVKQYPHPNLATYIGCQVSGDRITGICFAKYHSTLMQIVNPGSLMKRKSRSVRQKTEDYSQILGGVESGIRHLHSLGLVHNDINPRNIMLEGNIPIIVDFESCRPVGASLEGVGRTYEWYDENVRCSLPKNDLDALEEIRIWLSDDSTAFQFEE